jgi:ArsR family transcriptional regulator
MMNRTVKLFKSLADGTRLRIFWLLREAELNVHEIQQILDMSQSRISHHLGILKEVDLIQDRREGTWVFYRMNPDPPLSSNVFSEMEKLVAGESRIESDYLRLRKCLEQRRMKSLEFFNRSAEIWDRLSARIRSEEVLMTGLVSLLPANLSVLDAGTGTGVVLPPLAQNCRRVHAVDSSSEMLRKAKLRCDRLQLLNVHFQKADLSALPLRSASLDGVLANMSLHHVPDPHEVIREFARVIKPGGKIVIIDFVQHEYEWLREEEADLWLGFNTDDISRECREAGLERISIKRIEISLDHEGKEIVLELFVSSGNKPLITE